MPVKYSIVKDLDCVQQSAYRTDRICSADGLLFGKLVGLGGIEPPTSPLSGVRSSHLSYRPIWTTGGAGRDRTGDLLNANQALSQLSYSPSVLTYGDNLNRSPPKSKYVIEADWTRAAYDQHRQPEVHQTLSGDPKSRASSCDELNGVERLSLT
jgi:hypothetical protein